MPPQSAGTYPAHPYKPLFDVAVIPMEHIVAFHDLLEGGAQVVLCTKLKRPLWRRWNHHFPTLTHIVHHDGLIGHVPAQLGLIVFDVDHGTPTDIDDFCQMYPPLLRVPSNQPDREHLYYRCPSADRVKPWFFHGHGLQGEIRSHNSYAVLWGHAVVALRDALRDPDRTSGAPPLHLIGATPPPRTVDSHAPSPEHRDGPTASRGTSPNPELWHRLRHSAYRMRRGTDIVDWYRRVLDEAHRINESLGIPLSSSALEGMAQRTAEWTWINLPMAFDDIQGDYSRAIARKMGLASGAARRRGTPLEDDPTPWRTMGVTKYHYYKYIRFADERPDNPKPPPKPWLELGIKNSTFRGRLRRARDGEYPCADDGRPPWDYLGISEEVWLEYYAPKPQRKPDCHGFQTEPLIARGAAPGSSPDACYRTEPPARDGEDRSGADVRRRAPRNRPLEYAMADGVAQYLSMRERAHFADLRRLGLPKYGLQRPMPPFDYYNPYDPEHRKLYAIAKKRVASRNLKVARLIHAMEAQLGLAPPVPPWVAVKEKIVRTIPAWGGGITPHGQSATRARNLARSLVATQYPPAMYVEPMEDLWPDFSDGAVVRTVEDHLPYHGPSLTVVSRLR